MGQDNVLTIKNLQMKFAATDGSGKCHEVFSQLNFAQKKGAFVSIVGTSGCGKTTLLKIIGGLLRPSSGTVYLNNSPVEQPPDEAVFVFQDYNKSLLPWRTVANNVQLGLEDKGLSKNALQRRVAEYLRLVGLGAVHNWYPWQLSGGMQQRVAVARALACEPEVLLLDEPFGSLDAITKSNLEDEIIKDWTTLEMSVLFVTHDIDEAIYLSDRILVLAGAPAEIRLDVDVGLGRPREQVDTRAEPEFSRLRKLIYQTILDHDARTNTEI